VRAETKPLVVVVLMPLACTTMPASNFGRWQQEFLCWEWVPE